MSSRVEKYYPKEEFTTSSSTRSSRNARLYQVYGNSENLDNLPLEDNTAEIDMEKLKELVLKSDEKNKNQELREHLNVLEQKKRNIDEQKVYDINKILEKAKYENNKLKENTSTLPKIDKSILQTLQSTELSLPEIKKASEMYEELKKKQELEEKNQEDRLSMTRELKYHNLIEEEVPNNQVMDSDSPSTERTSDLSLDLFSDLKPTGNTIVTKPIREEEVVESKPMEPSDFRSSDTSDIDIIKPSPSSNESDFFTSSYEFSKKDFAYDEDFADLNQKGSIFKVILLVLAIIIFVGVIAYFIVTYGLGVS